MSFFGHYFVGGPTKLGEWLEIARSHVLLKQLSTLLPQRARILEIGPGRGRFAGLCIKAGYEYHAVEASPRGCELLRSRGIDAVEAFVPPLPPSDTKYDAICAWALLEHMPSLDTAIRLVESARDQLAEGGVLAIMSPELRAWGLNFWACDQTHTFPTSAQTTMFLFHDAGLDTVYCRFASGPFLGLSRFPFLLANKLNPWSIVEKLIGPRMPSRRLRNLKMGLSECFVLFGRKKMSG